MAFGDFVTNTRLMLMPAAAICAHELRVLIASWLVRVWAAATALLCLFTVMVNWSTMPSAPLIASVLFPFLVFPWFLVVFVLGISPVSGSRLDWLADGVLSRPITRYEYLLAAWSARVVVVVGIFLATAVPATVVVAAARRPAPEDAVTAYGAVAALSVVSLVLVWLVTLAFLTGTLLRRPLLAAVVLVFVWFPINVVLHTFSLEQFSPISLAQSIPTLLRTPWRSQNGRTKTRVDAGDLEALSRFLNVLSGAPGAHPEPEGFYEKGDYRDFSLLRVIVGYGVPTVLALAGALALFARRDL